MSIETNMVVVEGEDGFWVVESQKGGWLTVTQDDVTKKVRTTDVAEVPEEEDEDEVAVKMASTLRAYKPTYKPTTTHRGTKSLNNGDRIAELLAGCEPEMVAMLADRVLEQPDGFHRAKYDHLNPGQIRMNSGNRIRAFCKDGKEWDATNVEYVVKKAAEMGIREADEAA